MLCALMPLSGGVMAQNMSTYVGGVGNDKLEGMLRLSDGTVLAVGTTSELSWIPSGTTTNVLSMAAGASFDSRDLRGNRGMLLHYSAGLDTLKHVSLLPPGTVLDVTKIKTNSIPGTSTGNIYISGQRTNTNTGNSAGWYVAKLNNNFVNGVPTLIDYVLNVQSRGRSTNQFSGPFPNTGGDAADPRIWQPWDVQNDGKVVLATGTDFEANWHALERYKADGSARDTVGYWPVHWVNWRHSSGATGTTEVREPMARIKQRDSLWVNLGSGNNPNFDSVAIVEIAYSGTVLKMNRNGSNLRSYTQADFDLVTVDENRLGIRKGKFPEDFFYAAPCLTGNCSSAGPGQTGYSFFNPNNNVATNRVVAIAIDKRNNDLYYGNAYYSQHPDMQPYSWDFEPAVIAQKANGELKWFARCYLTSSVPATAGQVIDELALDYANNQVIVLGRSIGNSSINFWKSTELTGDPRPGVLSALTDPLLTNEVHTSWLGRYAMDSLRIFRSTYVAERHPTYVLGAASANPLMDGWDDLNQGTPRLADTRVRHVEVMPNGDVVVAGTSTGRTMTTANALQKMMKPDRDANLDSLAAPNAFVRVYSADFTEVKYSTLLTGIWDPRDGTQGDNVRIGGILPTLDGNGVLIAATADSALGSPLATAGGSVPLLNVPAYGNVQPVGREGVLARVLINATVVPTPALEGITGSVAGCQGQSSVYRIINPPSGVNFGWSLPNYRNWRGFSTADTIQVTGFAGQGGSLRAAALTANGLGDIVSFRLPAPNSTPRPTSLTTPGTSGPHCRGTVRTYRAGGVTGASSYVWRMPNSGWQQLGSGVLDSIVTTADSIRILVRDTTILGGPILVRAVGVCGPSLFLSSNRPAPATAPAIPAVSINNTTMTVTNNAGVTIQWFRDGLPIPGATTATYNTQGVAGCYAVRYRNGCDTSITAGCLTSMPVATALVGSKLYPNPTTGAVTLELAQHTTGAIEVRDLSGRLLGSQTLEASELRQPLDVKSLSAGLYQVVVKTPQGVWTTRLFKE